MRIKYIHHPAQGRPLYPNAPNCKQLGSDRLYRMKLTPLREFTMMQIMNQFTDKSDWDAKVRPN